MSRNILKPVVGYGFSEAVNDYVLNADEQPTPMRGGPSGRGWWFEQMAKACPELRNLYCPRCGTLLQNGACPKGCK